MRKIILILPEVIVNTFLGHQFPIQDGKMVNKKLYTYSFQNTGN